jgi:hypothetical protein
VEVESHNDDDAAVWRGTREIYIQQKKSPPSTAKLEWSKAESSSSRIRDACLHNLELFSVR